MIKFEIKFYTRFFSGKFCTIKNAVDKKSENKAHCVAKIFSLPGENDSKIMSEYESLRAVQHPNVVQLLNAYSRYTVEFL